VRRVSHPGPYRRQVIATPQLLEVVRSSGLHHHTVTAAEQTLDDGVAGSGDGG
jgi:hypothetical protein